MSGADAIESVSRTFSSGLVNVIIAPFLAYLREESLPSISKNNRPNTLDDWVQPWTTRGLETNRPMIDRGGEVFEHLGPSTSDYRGLGGCGFGTPVVSYAPRPMVEDVKA